MKNIFLKSSLTCILIFLVSCSSESTTELNVLDESLNLEKAIDNSKIGHISYQKNNYINDNKGLISKFKNDTLMYQYSFEEKFNYSYKYIPEKNKVKIFNKNTNESIFITIKRNKNKVITFDLSTSIGLEAKTVSFYLKKNDLASNPQYWWLIQPVIEFVIDLVNDSKTYNEHNYDSNCRAAIQACGESGVDYIKIIEGNWFSKSSCEVRCKHI